jgi:hypothetical protein
MNARSLTVVLSLVVVAACSNSSDSGNSGGAGGSDNGGSGGDSSGGGSGGKAGGGGSASGGSASGGSGGSASGGSAGSGSGGSAMGGNAGGKGGAAGGGAAGSGGAVGGMGGVVGGAGGTANVGGAGGTGGVAMTTDTATINFEVDTQSWGFIRETKNEGLTPVPSRSTEKAFAGKASLKVHLDLKLVPGPGKLAKKYVGFDMKPLGDLKAGNVIVSHLWTPAGAKLIAASFTANGGAYGDNINQFMSGGLQENGWTTFELTVTAGLLRSQEVGFEFTPLGADWSGDVYIDTVKLK